MKKYKFLIIIVLVFIGIIYYEYNYKVVDAVVSYATEDKTLIFDTLSDEEIWKIISEISKNPSNKNIKSIEKEYIDKGYKVDFSKLQIIKFTRSTQKKQKKKLEKMMEKGYSKNEYPFLINK